MEESVLKTVHLLRGPVRGSMAQIILKYLKQYRYIRYGAIHHNSLNQKLDLILVLRTYQRILMSTFMVHICQDHFNLFSTPTLGYFYISFRLFLLFSMIKVPSQELKYFQALMVLKIYDTVDSEPKISFSKCRGRSKDVP